MVRAEDKQDKHRTKQRATDRDVIQGPHYHLPHAPACVVLPWEAQTGMAG